MMARAGVGLRLWARALLALSLVQAATGGAADAPPPAAPPAAPPAHDAARTDPAPSPAIVAVEVIARFPHDTRAFTQGLIAEGDTLYESTGQYGESEVRRVELATGRVLARSAIPPDQFGEGLVRWQGQLISLTWQHGIAHRWDAATLTRVGEARYPGEGWGLTLLGDELILSDGTDSLRVLDPATFTERRRIAVTAGGQPVHMLNELEVVDGRIWANVWMTGWIIVIDPASGRVTHALDLRPLVREVMATAPGGDPVEAQNNVLNGIAFDPRARRLFVTGKRWPVVFELRVPDFRAAP